MFAKKDYTKKIICLLAVLFAFLLVNSPAFGIKDANDISFYKPSSQTEPYPLMPDSKVKNIIFCIGDGMGLSQVALARIKAAGKNGKLYMERMPISAIVRTHSANSLVTDSAASATALATGYKTRNGMIGMLPNGQKCLTILEAARDKGMATGIVATSTITHATPASFAAHVTSRKRETSIAKDIIANKPNVILGGGKKFFVPKSTAGSKRNDELDLISDAKKAGYSYVENRASLKAAKGPYILGLFQMGPMTTEPPEPMLTELMQKAIDVLSKNKNGFFLMVEGSQIDWACHKEDAPRAVKQTLLFDEAIKAAIDFALKDGHTLVVVTADHETGGLIIKKGNKPKQDISLNWATKSHSASPVPLYAFGPAAEMFAGVYDNTEIPKKFAKLLGIKAFPKIAQ